MAPSGGPVTELPTASLPALVASLEAQRPRWVWWSAAHAARVVAAGLQLAACWDLAAVHRLLAGGRRDDEAAVVASAFGRPIPPLPDDGLTLLHRDGSARASDRPLPDRASLALETQAAQAAMLAEAVDPRARPVALPLPLATAHSESAAALLAVELEHYGLPFSADVARRFLLETVGPPGASPALRDAAVFSHFTGTTTDLRNPLKVRDWLGDNGFDLPDTRSWRLEPFAPTSPGIAALLAWRKTERIATTYGYDWLSVNVREGRLRGHWGATDGAGGRMTASSGLHNLPAELRGCVIADPGHVLVRADLGQIEPRVLAVVSGDPGFTAATRDTDLYAPVAAALGVDRPTAKVAVLAAMYGQTTGPAGAALARMDRAYPLAMAYLRDAEERGRAGVDVRTWGGRTVPLGGPVSVLPEGHTAVDRSRGRYARNAVVQGAAAEFFKAWAATVRAGLPAYQARIVLCLHDELLVHTPTEHAAAVEKLLHRAVASTASWWATGSGVRFVAVTSAARSWAEAKD